MSNILLLNCIRGATIKKKGMPWAKRLCKVVRANKNKDLRTVVKRLQDLGMIAPSTGWYDCGSVRKMLRLLKDKT